MGDDFLVQFGAVVRRLRLQARMTQAALAERLGMARTSISNLEAGSQNLSIGALPTLAAALGIPPDVLVAEALHSSAQPSASDPLTAVEDPALRDWAARVMATKQVSPVDQKGVGRKPRNAEAPS
jgi:transcriptional regulator with XRE-family HTH domain